MSSSIGPIEAADIHLRRAAPSMWKAKHLEFVVKLSKFCNLRCSYCYEFEDLHKKDRMALEQIRSMFVNIFAHATLHDVKTIEFCWHGGEPFLFKPSFFREIGSSQATVFGTHVVVSNIVQTNLTVLSEEMLSFLEERSFFSGLGVSFDPYGSQRVDTRGRLRTETITKNMQTLIDHRIPFGAITVVSRDTLDSVSKTFEFFDALSLGHRFLPYYRSANPEQARTHSLTYDEILLSHMKVVDAWFVSANAPESSPIDEYMAYAQKSLARAASQYFDYWQDEFIFIVDVDGGTWGVMGAYEPEAQYGNLFEQAFTDILAADSRQKLNTEIKQRAAVHCGACQYYGACPGQYVVQATAAERDLIDSRGCIVKDVISHILQRCEETGMSLALALSGRPITGSAPRDDQ